MDEKHSTVKFLLFLLTISDGFRLALTATQSLQSNVTQFVGTTVVIPCVDSMGNTYDNPDWIKNPGRVVVYDASTKSIADSTKYLVWNGSSTLAVWNVQPSDATSYCCVVGVTDYCANVVVIDSMVASVNPANGVHVGDSINLTCTLIYNAPPSDAGAPFPLADNQDPELTMYVGQNAITTGELLVNTDTEPHSKSISFKRTITADDAGKNLTCKVFSSNPLFQSQTTTPMNVYAATTIAEIRYPDGAKSTDDFYPLASWFTCVGDGFPSPIVSWIDGDTNSILRQEIGSVTWQFVQHGKYNLTCSASNSLSQNAIYNATRVLGLVMYVYFPAYAKSLTSVYWVNEIFVCDASSPAEVTWSDTTTPTNTSIISSGIGNATAKILSAGKYKWKCTSESPRKTIVLVNEFSFTAIPTEVSSGLKIFLPILLTICCELFLACVIF